MVSVSSFVESITLRLRIFAWFILLFILFPVDERINLFCLFSDALSPFREDWECLEWCCLRSFYQCYYPVFHMHDNIPRTPDTSSPLSCVLSVYSTPVIYLWQPQIFGLVKSRSQSAPLTHQTQQSARTMSREAPPFALTRILALPSTATPYQILDIPRPSEQNEIRRAYLTVTPSSPQAPQTPLIN